MKKLVALLLCLMMVVPATLASFGSRSRGGTMRARVPKAASTDVRTALGSKRPTTR